jgi:hypothetical protein
MTDTNILNDSELQNQIPFSVLREPTEWFLKDLEKIESVLSNFDIQLISSLSSNGIAIKSIKRFLNTYPYTIPVAMIETANKNKNLIIDKFLKTGIILSEFNGHEKYKEIYDSINKKEVN